MLPMKTFRPANWAAMNIKIMVFPISKTKVAITRVISVMAATQHASFLIFISKPLFHGIHRPNQQYGLLHLVPRWKKDHFLSWF